MSVFLIYKPEGVEPKRWEVDLNKLMSVEAEAIEKATGTTYAEWTDLMGRGSVGAMHALIWIYLKRETPSLEFRDVVFSMDEIDTEEVEDPKAP